MELSGTYLNIVLHMHTAYVSLTISIIDRQSGSGVRDILEFDLQFKIRKKNSQMTPYVDSNELRAEYLIDP